MAKRRRDRRPRLTSRTKLGLEEIYRLSWADVECAEPGDWSVMERADLARAFVYLAKILGKPGGP